MTPEEIAAAEAAAAAAKEAEEAALAAKAAEDAKKAGAKPSDEEARLLKDVMKHKTRAAELESKVNDLGRQIKEFEGVDLAKVRALLAEQEAAEQKRLVAAGDFDRLTKQMAERHTTEKTALEQQVAESNRAAQSLQQQIAELTVGTAFTGSKFVSDELTLTPAKARVIYGSHFEFKDGKVVGYDKPAGASDRTVLVNSTGDALSFEEAMRKIVDADPDRDQLIRSKMRPGAGSTTNPKAGKKADEVAQRSMTSVERIAAGLKALAK